ncbi:hypothetical protein [Culicoidibacter larvae]|uniref:Uncharacterized protein n=1 Tax=Culicoidibacter larvae TaxID=2579976 RepID=A0A5R8QAL3_9FIRM|nr:hypothetical protein [Culicoidibacter larvae]TLG72943.1 hypothetical protein FEZ08_07805 [Culicoidibacter larvae]
MQKNVDRIEHKFLQIFPEGLSGDDWNNAGKRHNPDKIFEIFQTELTKEALELTLDSGDYEETIDAITAAVRRVSVISVFEKFAFKNYIAHQEIHGPFLEALYQFMYNFNEESFDGLVSVLLRYRHEKNTNPAKWPVVSFFKAYADPDNYVFVKPNTVKGEARVMEWDIQYKSMPNYQTYMQVMEMVKAFRKHSTLCQNENLMITQAVMFCALEL